MTDQEAALKKLKERSESDLYNPIVEWLNIQYNTKAWRESNHAMYSQKLKTYLKLPKKLWGKPDIMGVKRKVIPGVDVVVGQFFAFEVKHPSKNLLLREAQREWLQEFVDCGGAGFVVDSLDDVIKCFDEI